MKEQVSNSTENEKYCSKGNKLLTFMDFCICIGGGRLGIEANASFQKYLKNKYNVGRLSIDTLLKEDYLVIDTRQSDMRLYHNICPTLRTGRHEILYVKNGKLRYLFGSESLLLQGFPISIVQKSAHLADFIILSQADNAMTVSVISAIGNELLKCYS